MFPFLFLALLEYSLRKPYKLDPSQKRGKEYIFEHTSWIHPLLTRMREGSPFSLPEFLDEKSCCQQVGRFCWPTHSGSEPWVATLDPPPWTRRAAAAMMTWLDRSAAGRARRGVPAAEKKKVPEVPGVSSIWRNEHFSPTAGSWVGAAFREGSGGSGGSGFGAVGDTTCCLGFQKVSFKSGSRNEAHLMCREDSSSSLRFLQDRAPSIPQLSFAICFASFGFRRNPSADNMLLFGWVLLGGLNPWFW